MTLLIVGATGTLGRQIARRAIDEGYTVRCLVRSPQKAAFLKEWGADVVRGDLNAPNSIKKALDGVTAIIDAATARTTDNIKQVDWDGKVNLIQAAVEAKIDRYVFLSILNAEQYADVPLMEIKRCTELFLAESGLNYTILRPSGFLQGLIGQYAIPILEGQSVWVTGETAPIGYVDTQDLAKFAVRALSVPETEKKAFPVVGKGWTAYQIIELCEKLSSKEAKITKVSLSMIRSMKGLMSFFQWGWNIADRLAFSEVISSGKSLTADMTETYQVFGLDAKDTTTLESYLGEYFNRILKKLKEIDYQRNKDKKKPKKNFLIPF